MTLEELSRTITNINSGINSLVTNAMAYLQIETRRADAISYCEKYSMPNAWGRNIWHVILDDAIRMRNEQEQAKLSIKEK